MQNMQSIKLSGKRALHGDVVISGAKNGALPLMAASLLAPGLCLLSNVPDLQDIATMSSLLTQFGVAVEVVGKSTPEDGSVNRKLAIDASWWVCYWEPSC
jgi:UDP-N-acetylglucosamine 1-carboxyvinyltransferase